MPKVMEMRVDMHCQRCRTKALKIAAGTGGVSSVRIEGRDRDTLVVTGEEFDELKLIKDLKNRVGFTRIVSFSNFN